MNSDQPRPAPSLARDAHKGRAGRLLAICGSREMPGAAVLVTRAAYRAGAGRVTLACLDCSMLPSIPIASPETVLLDLSDCVGSVEEISGDENPGLPGQGYIHARVAGPGLGNSLRTFGVVQRLLLDEYSGPQVLDADALNVLVPEPSLMKRHRGPLVITPHAGEAASLAKRCVPSDDEGRIELARELAETTGSICVLKGYRTVITDGERVAINESGNSGMATAGSGDVLTGMLGAYLASSNVEHNPDFGPFEAVRAAVYVHGLAGDLASEELGRRSVIASDLVDFMPRAHRRFEASEA